MTKKNIYFQDSCITRRSVSGKDGRTMMGIYNYTNSGQ